MGLDSANAEAAVAAALDAGISRFDHADIYNRGRSESAFGDLLARDPGLRARIELQTKCGIQLEPKLYDLRGATIRDRVAASLERLRTDVIDTLLLHRPDALAQPDDIAEAFAELQSQGLVRRFGVSNMSAPRIAHLQASLDLPLVANQIEMSLLQRDWLEPGDGTVEHCQANGIEIQAWGPLAQGRYAEGALGALVVELARAHDTTPETIALWWLQRHPARIVPVIGTTNPRRIRACADAVSRTPDLTHEEWYALWTAARAEPLP